DELEHAVNVHLTATEHDDNIVFLHNVHEGPASQSYGLQVAKLAGVPQEVIRHAKEQLTFLESSVSPAEQSQRAAEYSSSAATAASHQHPVMQGDMFGSLEPSAVENVLKDLKLDELTPREALNQLYALQDMLNK